MKLKILALDVSRALFRSYVARKLYVELPEEDKDPNEDMVGRLLRCLYGTRDAAHLWQEYSIDIFVNKLKMAVGASNPCLFSQESTDTIAWEHGDDVVIVGEEETLLGMEEELQKHMILKRRALLGPDPEGDKHITILNRHIT